jgi:RNA polymerase sigma factor (sigma-70 family)
MRPRDAERRQRFEELFEAYGADIVSYCSWRLGHAGDAQDAVADTFLTAWRRLESVPEGEAARLWLYATARRTVANHRRAGHRRRALRERIAQERTTAPGWAEPPREGAPVLEALRRIAPRDREVLLLAEWEGLTPAQIATVLGSPAVSVRGRLHRARRRFRAAFDELQAADAPEPRLIRAALREGGS